MKLIHSQITEGTNKKGDVFAVAQVAAIMAAKSTSSIIPMCHPIPLTGVDIRFEWNIDESAAHYEVLIEAEVKTKGVTGVEMEALTAASAAALTIYDMCKAAGKEMVIGPTMLLRKTGGKNGDFRTHKMLNASLRFSFLSNALSAHEQYDGFQENQLVHR